MTRIYAIGDIHGQRAMLEAAHDRITADRARTGDETAPVVHLGDLIDRGPDSRGVIEHLMAGIARGENWIVLKGNHDRFLPLFLNKGETNDGRLRRGLSWLSSSMGGAQTLGSYGVWRKLMEAEAAFRDRAREAVPEAHLAFMEGLSPYYRHEGLLFVHAGIRPGIALEDQSEDDLMWIRDEFLWHLGDHPWLVVHGHTPVETAQHYGNRVNLDTGAGYGDPLTAAVFEDGEVFVLDAVEGRVRLAPPPERTR